MNCELSRVVLGERSSTNKNHTNQFMLSCCHKISAKLSQQKTFRIVLFSYILTAYTHSHMARSSVDVDALLFSMVIICLTLCCVCLVFFLNVVSFNVMFSWSAVWNMLGGASMLVKSWKRYGEVEICANICRCDVRRHDNHVEYSIVGWLVLEWQTNIHKFGFECNVDN